MKYFSLTTRIAVLAAALTFWLSPAALHAQAVTSSLQVPLAGTVFVPLSDGNVEGVPLSGFVHVFAQVRTPGPFSPTSICWSRDFRLIRSCRLVGASRSIFRFF